MENNLKSNKNITIKIYFNNSVEDIIISSDATITELGKKICDKFLLSHFNYTISYIKMVYKIIKNSQLNVHYLFLHLLLLLDLLLQLFFVCLELLSELILEPNSEAKLA